MQSVETTRNCCLCGHVGYIRKTEKSKPVTLVMECPVCHARWRTMLLPRKKAVG